VLRYLAEDVQTFEKAVVGKKRASPQSDPEESESDDVPEPKRRKVLPAIVSFGDIFNSLINRDEMLVKV
jgi:hypothetical protein